MSRSLVSTHRDSSNTKTKKVVVIFGASGIIGTEVAKILSAEYPHWEIRAVMRNVAKPSHLASLQLPNVTLVTGDPVDAISVVECSKNCDLVFCCVGLHKYEARYWSKHWPMVVNNLLNSLNQANDNAAAAEPQDPSARRRPRRRLVFCDNLYAYGAGNSAPISPSTTPTVKASLEKGKPHIRSWMHEVMTHHMQDHPDTLTVVGAADFFGPHATANSFLGDSVTGKIVQGKNALAIGSVQRIHDFCYAPDFARALTLVAVQEDKAYNRFWIAPHAIHGKTVQEIANDIAKKVHPPVGSEEAKKRTRTSGTKVAFSVLNKWMLYLLSPFMSFMKEMIEMEDFWTKDYQVDDSEFCQTFGVQATDYHEALTALVDFYESRSPTK